MNEMSQSPLISIIVPVFNSADYICRCLDSILCQSYTNFEIICIDDGSTDCSGSILDEYQANHSNMVFVTHQANTGIAAARNVGIKKARGSYIAFVDNDDWLDCNWLESLTSLIDYDNPPDVICSGYRRPDKNGNIVTECSLSEHAEWSPYLIGAPWAKLFRTNYIREKHYTFFETNIGEDLPFVVPAVHNAVNCVVTSYSGYNWYYNTDSVSNTIHKMSKGLQFEKMLNRLLVVTEADSSGSDHVITRYFIRQIGWFLFYTRKADGIKLTLSNLKYYERWLDCNFKTWRNCSIATPYSPSGDPFMNRVAVWLLAKHPLLFRLMLICYHI